MPFSLSQRARLATEQPISFLMAEALRRPDLISLAAGFVDPETLPAEAAAGLLQEVLGDPAAARAALQYGTTQGDPALRRALYEHLAALDELPPERFPGSADSIVVTTGSQQLLHLLTDLLVDPGDLVITAWPSYFVYTGALSAFGATVRAVEMDDGGLVPDRLDALLSELHQTGDLGRVKIVYVQSAHQNPTGITLAEDRREPILQIVRRYSQHAGHRILLIEDAAYRELTYPPASIVRSIKRHDVANEHVALLQTFSKPFAPGLKTGYGLVPDDLIEPIILAKGGRDFGSANLCQHLLRDALVSGRFWQHIGRLQQTYAAKRDAMLAALEEHLGPLRARIPLTWTHPAGGLYIWLTLPGIDTGRRGPLFTRALDAGVLFVPGEFCYPSDPTRTIPRHQIRLSFGVPTIPQIHRGIARLAEALERVTDG